MNNSSALEIVRREMVQLLLSATVVAALFAITSAFRLVVAKLAGLIGPGTIFVRILYFGELTLFGVNACLAMFLTLRAAWNILQAILLDRRGSPSNECSND